MSVLKRFWKWASATDAALSWADRALRLLGISTGLSLLSGVITWLIANPYAALVVGLAVWILAMASLLVQTTKQAASKVPLPLGSVSTDDVAEHTAAPTGEPPQRPPARGGSALYPVLQEHELGQTYFKNHTIYIAELAREIKDSGWVSTVIKGRTFEDCRIYGPAVLAPLNTGTGTTIDHDCKYMDGIETGWLGKPEDHPRFVGTIGLQECVFRNCRFEDCGVLVTDNDYWSLREEPETEPTMEA